MAYRKVLIPLDGSKEAEGVVRAVEADLDDDAEVVFLQVIRPASSFIPEAGPGGFDRTPVRAHGEAMSYCKALLEQLEGNVRGRCSVTEGAPVFQAIVNEAVAGNADLVAMYTHDREGLASVRSISANVQRRVPLDAIDFRVLRPEEIPSSRGSTQIFEAVTPKGGEAMKVVEATRSKQITTDEGTSEVELDVLRRVDLFRELTDEQIEEIALLGQPMEIHAGQALVQAGESGNLLFVVVRGFAQLTARSGIGEIPVRAAGPGSSFPLAALVGSGTLITSAEAMTDMTLMALPRGPLLSLCRRDPAIGMGIYAAIADVFGARYRKTLAHLTSSSEHVLRQVDFFTNV